MTPEQIEKSIRQMRQVFFFFGVLITLMVMWTLWLAANNEDPSPVFCCISPMSPALLLGYYGLGKRNKNGYLFAQIGSAALFIGFPILTYFGISYLRKLSQPEMKKVFGYEIE